MSCSKVSTEGATGGEEVGRCCAFCLNPLSPSEIRKCSKCHRRAYCSKECQTADWKGRRILTPMSSPKAIGFGQGHKEWCGLTVGEEGVDWAIKEIPGKGKGIVALRDLPPLYRVFVEGLQHYGQPGLEDHTGWKMLSGPQGPEPFTGRNEMEKKFKSNAMGAQLFDIVLGFRHALVNHACGANATPFLDESMHVVFVFTNRQVAAGEEICIDYRMFNDVSSSTVPVPDPVERASYLRRRYGIVCPPSCVCKDLDIRSKLEKMSAMVMPQLKLVAKVGNRAASAKAVKYMTKVLKIAEKLEAGPAKLSPKAMANLHYAALEACCCRQETVLQGKVHYEKIVEYSRAVAHPDSTHNFETTRLGKAMKDVYYEGNESPDLLTDVTAMLAASAIMEQSLGFRP